MKQKEIKNLAKKIAEQERIIQNTDSIDERRKAEREIVRLSSGIKSMEDIVALDEAIQDLLEKNS